MELTDFVKEHVTNGSKLISSYATIKKKFPDQYTQIMQSYPEYTTFADKANAIYHGDYRRCGHCGNIFSYSKQTIFCSRKCFVESGEFANRILPILQSDESRKKKRQTNIERYGVEVSSQCESVKVKYKATMMERYGVTTNLILPETIAQNKINSHTPDVNARRRQTNIERYGGASPMASKEVRKKSSTNRKAVMLEAKKQKFRELDIPFVDVPIGRHGHYKSDDMILQATGYNPVDVDTVRKNYVNWRHHAKQLGMKLPKSYFETEIAEYLDSLGVEYIHNCRRVIPPQEVDFYLPNHQIAIEANGVYWHDSFKIDTQYHKQKTLACLNNDVQLLHIWEHDWIYKKDIIKSIIKSKLGLTTKLYARKCDIAEVNAKDARVFFDTNHLKGFRGAHVHIGLMFDGELVMCMSFGKHDAHQWELVRMASKLDLTVVGGMSKIMNRWIKQYNPDSIMSYADMDISTGKSYESVGFSKLKLTSPSYWYVNKRTLEVIDRRDMQKSKLVSLDTYNENLSEGEIIQTSNQYYRIHNAGNIVYISHYLH